MVGELWEVHGGGFYHVQKYRVAPRVLPERLAWFKWEAYTTWLSGFALLCIVYFSNARAYLIDKSVADLTVPEAIAITVGLLVAAGSSTTSSAGCSGAGRSCSRSRCSASSRSRRTSRGSCSQPRAMFIIVGSMIGTMMAGNVLFVIIPGHWELIRAKQAGREPDPAPGMKAKLRSVHNNYLTLPVVLAMLSNHFPFVYGHDDAWLVLCAFVALGVVRAPLLQPAARRPHALVDAGRRGGGRRRHGLLAGAAGRALGAGEQRDCRRPASGSS